MLLEAIELRQGNLAKTSHDLGVGRRLIYKMIWREDLWGQVNEIRELAIAKEPEWLRKTRAVLRGGEHGVSTM